MKSRNLIILFIFGVFLFLLPSLAEALCPIGCTDQCYALQPNPSGCYWFYGGSVDRLGILGTLECCNVSTYHEFGSCSETANPQNKCKEDAFPSGYNGQSCTARDRKLTITGCEDCSKTGSWDYFESQCVECSGKIENRILGNTTVGGVGDSCNDNFPAGDGLCESACGANSACDEVTDGKQ